MKNNKSCKTLTLIGSICLVAATLFLYSCGGGGSSTPAAQTPSGSWGTMTWGTGNWGGP